MGHIIGSDGLEIRRMYIYVINEEGQCAFQYLIHFFCLIKMDQQTQYAGQARIFDFKMGTLYTFVCHAIQTLIVSFFHNQENDKEVEMFTL